MPRILSPELAPAKLVHSSKNEQERITCGALNKLLGH